MNMFEIEPKSLAPPPGRSPRDCAVIGLVEFPQFSQAQAAIAGLSDCSDYDDWLDRREGLQIGLAMTGVNAAIVRVDLASFLEWRSLTGAAFGECALDAFAALALAVRAGAITRTLATISESDFAIHAPALATVAGKRSYARWLRYRSTRRVKWEALGARIAQLPVRVDAFLAWCGCLEQPATEEMLDRYAQLTLERLATLDCD